MPGRALDVTDAEAVRATLDAVRPWGVFHAAGVRSRSDADLDPDRCLRLHAGSPALIGAACAERSIRLVQLSSSLVLSGPGPCDESAPVRPRSVLGEAQAEGERRAARAHPRALVLRCGHVVGLDRTDDLLAAGLAALASRRVWTVQDGAAVVLASSLVSVALDLLVDGERGVWHVAHRRSWFDLARAAAALAGFAPSDVRLAPAADAVQLATIRGHLLPPCSAPLRERIARLGTPSSPRLEMEAS
jgi:dTDP-4-dehydrorhamnose reductase